jgi:Phosphotransferase enzyme family
VTDTWTTDLYVVLRHPDGTRVLTQAGQLPHLHLEKRVWLADIEPFHAELREHLGDVIVLRCMKYETNSTTRQARAVYELEGLGKLRGDWLKASQLHPLPAEIESVVHAALSEVDPEARSPWARRGWFTDVRDWIGAQIKGVERVEQVKSWGMSCVLRARTAQGNFYFKASTRRALFADEPRVTQALATRFPDLIPMPVQVNVERGWMILADIGTNLRDATLRIPEWKQLIQRYAELQRELALEPDWVLNAGCLDRRQHVLETQLRELLEAETTVISPEQLQTLRETRVVWTHHLSKLSASSIPNSLVHGDWHPGNIAVKDGVQRIFDWTDACLSQPFFDILGMLDELEQVFDEETRQALLETYLGTWTEFASLGDMKAVVPSIRVALCLHQVVTYWKILGGLEPTARHEVAKGLGYWLRRLTELC